jgi:hypothetical protein
LLRIICIAGLYLGVCEIAEYLLVRRRDAEVFPPKLGWRLLQWFGIAACMGGIAVSVRPMNWKVWVYLGLLFVFLLRWPRTVLVDSSAISSCSLFGLLHRSIPWGEASRVSSEPQEPLRWGLIAIWTSTGCSVTVSGRDGSTVQHGIVNKDQGGFLNALRRFVPRQAFDPGLYDWHPETATKSRNEPIGN